ncbi:MAG TPA: hypothetical protein VMG12_24565 [Polyangiaceae bacterium]|nr:hypothetical protein [Polyangiaceae bacterium]
MQNTHGACLALSVAALFASACERKNADDAGAKTTTAATSETEKSMPAPPAPGSGKVQCLGIHECKGKSDCHVIGSHACAGQNTCKGKGWISVPAEECQAKGGKVIES